MVSNLTPPNTHTGILEMQYALLVILIGPWTALKKKLVVRTLAVREATVTQGWTDEMLVSLSEEDYDCLAVTEREMRMEQWVVDKSNKGDREITMESSRTSVINIIMGDLMQENKGFLTSVEMLEYMSSV